MKYTSASEFFKQRYGTKVYRLSLSSGCSCPNRDGTISTGGCTFCSEGGSGDFASKGDDIRKQIEDAKKKVDAKFPKNIGINERKYIAYFQSYSNTYGDADRLKKLYMDAFHESGIVALSIGTRPDCFNDEIYEMISELVEQGDVYIELGLQTIHEKSAKAINRGYELSAFDKTYQRLKQIGAIVIVHVILGLPDETVDEMLETVDYLARLTPRLDGIKLQLLHVLKGTELGRRFMDNPFKVFTLEEYCYVVGECLKRLPKEIVIHRITGDGPKKLLIAPLWSADKKRVLNTMNQYIQKL